MNWKNFWAAVGLFGLVLTGGALMTLLTLWVGSFWITLATFGVAMLAGALAIALVTGDNGRQPDYQPRHRGEEAS